MSKLRTAPPPCVRMRVPQAVARCPPHKNKNIRICTKRVYYLEQLTDMSQNVAVGVLRGTLPILVLWCWTTALLSMHRAQRTGGCLFFTHPLPFFKALRFFKACAQLCVSRNGQIGPLNAARKDKGSGLRGDTVSVATWGARTISSGLIQAK